MHYNAKKPLRLAAGALSYNIEQTEIVLTAKQIKQKPFKGYQSMDLAQSFLAEDTCRPFWSI